jgi:hypothetical protein
MARNKPFHVYAEDGFEEAYASERSALSHARQGSKRRQGVSYRVIVVGPEGYTGGGKGRKVAEFSRGKKVE